MDEVTVNRAENVPVVIAGVGMKISKSIDVNRFDISKYY